MLRLSALLAILFPVCAFAQRRIAPDALGDATADLAYTTLGEPCRIIDTRIAGGQLASARSFHVAGSASLADQGGSATGCGIPAGAGAATAVMINFVAVDPSGAGNLRGSAWPNPVPSTGSIINYQSLVPALNVANGVIFPICDATTSPCGTGFDITLQPNGAGTDLVADVIGYFSHFTTSGSLPLTFTALAQPCRIIDTRVAGGAIAAGSPRQFKVSGTSGFEAQGGTAGGCGIPPSATVAMINFVAVNAQGAGNLKGASFPNTIPATGSIINYQLLTPALNIANGVLFPLCDSSTTTCAEDITLQPNASGTDVVADVLGYFAAGAQPSGAMPNTQQNLTYTTFQQPCRIIDTRVAGGALVARFPRNFKVAGTTGFDLQGGTAGGCGVPRNATAAMINFVAVAAEGAGNLKGSAFPAPIPATGSVINYQSLNPAINIANGILFPICDAAEGPCADDVILQANAAGVHVVADVMGYAARPFAKTVTISPSSVRVVTGGLSAQFTVTLDAPAVVDSVVALSTNPPATGTFVPTVTIPAGQSSANFAYVPAGSPGACTITASFGSSGSSARIDNEPAVCGNGIREPGEECDDGNTANLDGCSAQCLFEQNQRMNQIKLQSAVPAFTPQCTANVFGGAFASSALSVIQTSIDSAVANGSATNILAIGGPLDGGGPATANVGFFGGTPVAAPSGTTYNGNNDLDWWYVADPTTIDPNRLPSTVIPGSFDGTGSLTAGPGTPTVAIGLGSVRTSNVFLKALRGTVTTPTTSTGSTPGHTAGEHLDPALTSYHSLGDSISGDVCGNIVAASLALLPMPASLQIGGATACTQGYGPSNSLLDLMVGGCNVFILTEVTPKQPDQVVTGATPAGAGGPYKLSASGANHIVDTCLDKNNSVVDFTTCVNAAAYSSYFKFSTDRVIATCARPAPPAASNGGPYCAGQTVQLNAAGPAGSYHWTGPNGFDSTQQDPTIASASPFATGTYSVTVTTNGCPSLVATTDVVVNDVPAPPPILAASAVPAGADGLTASVPLHAGSAYTWIVVNGTLTSGQGTNQITFTAGSSGSVQISIMEANSGCSATNNITIPIN